MAALISSLDFGTHPVVILQRAHFKVRVTIMIRVRVRVRVKLSRSRLRGLGSAWG